MWLKKIDLWQHDRLIGTPFILHLFSAAKACVKKKKRMATHRDNVEIVSSLDCVEGNDSVVMAGKVFLCMRVHVWDRERKRDRCGVMMACAADGRGLPSRTWWMEDDVIRALTCCNCSSEEAKPHSELWIWSLLYISDTKDICSVSTLRFMLFKMLPPPTVQPKEGWWILSAWRKMCSL